MLPHETAQLEEKLKQLEETITSDLNENQDYRDCKSNLENFYQIKADGIRLRSRCDWYEYGEKSSKFF